MITATSALDKQAKFPCVLREWRYLQAPPHSATQTPQHSAKPTPVHSKHAQGTQSVTVSGHHLIQLLPCLVQSGRSLTFETGVIRSRQNRIDHVLLDQSLPSTIVQRKTVNSSVETPLSSSEQASQDACVQFRIARDQDVGPKILSVRCPLQRYERFPRCCRGSSKIVAPVPIQMSGSRGSFGNRTGFGNRSRLLVVCNCAYRILRFGTSSLVNTSRAVRVGLRLNDRLWSALLPFFFKQPLRS